ncbi:MAG: hypothetical protein ACRENG_12975, partial [bacterium]
IVAESLHLAAHKLGNAFLFAGHAGNADELLAKNDDFCFALARDVKEIAVHGHASFNIII